MALGTSKATVVENENAAALAGLPPAFISLL